MHREFIDIWWSESVKKGIFKAELVNSSLYEWDVHVIKFPSGSQLHFDLQEVKRRQFGDDKVGEILLNIRFNAKHPQQVPFFRLIGPTLICEIVFGGALCMEILMKPGWSSDLSVEFMILQIIDALVAGKGRIDFGSFKVKCS